MLAPRPDSVVFLCLASVHFAYWLAWAGSLALSVALVVLVWTRWGQSRPLQKCAALSLLVHLILAFLAMTVRIVAGDGNGGGGGGAPIHVRILQETTATATAKIPATQDLSNFSPPDLLERPPMKVAVKPQTVVGPPPVAKNEEAPSLKNPTAHEPLKSIAEATKRNKSNQARSTPTPPAQAVAKQSDPATSRTALPTSPDESTAHTPTAASEEVSAISSPYALRSASDRLSLIEGQGGSAKTEEAVVAALSWLAAAQSADGRWSANQFGAGQEQMVLGQSRGGAGRNADTGVSALALLAFLGAGHSHLQGEYRDTVRRGLDFLLRSQAADGSLFGDATLYAQMYCHSMATFALAEDEAITGDRRLEPAVTRAVNFSLAAQDTSGGGWRYRPGDSGDTSQMGWQLMALASAKRAGINIPHQTWNRVDRFLRSVSRGNFSGLASYRPDSPASTSMTAEALYCHLVLEEMSGVGVSESAAEEATDKLLAELPLADRVNLYYWYYATLALHHRQQASNAASAAWHTWNDALTTALLNTQVPDGQNVGSWNTTTLWGGYGGRVYTTAMATMCLEVYYRYAPTSNGPDHWMATRPDSERDRE
ncbi:MAG TPA: squalene--hopene cyclase [Lacipirellulaceae bacterium]|nr:squalene--hopene cyclase [Lacipirellulaceae bacterium]